MNHLLIFIKNIEKGKVKTRLASTVGDDRALEIYQALLNHTREVACAVDAERFLFYSSHIEKEDGWSEDFFDKKIQEQGTLGKRMSSAFEDVFWEKKSKEKSKIIIVGSDCAQLSPEILNLAFEKLEEYSFVIGPTFDGGYYLLGMNTFEPSVFENIQWSTEQVFPTTISRIESIGKNYFLLPQLSDIDYEEDWVKYGWKI